MALFGLRFDLRNPPIAGYLDDRAVPGRHRHGRVGGPPGLRHGDPLRAPRLATTATCRARWSWPRPWRPAPTRIRIQIAAIVAPLPRPAPSGRRRRRRRPHQRRTARHRDHQRLRRARVRHVRPPALRAGEADQRDGRDPAPGVDRRAVRVSRAIGPLDPGAPPGRAGRRSAWAAAQSRRPGGRPAWATTSCRRRRSSGTSTATSSAKLGKPDPGPHVGGDTSFFHVASDVDAGWEAIAPYAMHEVNSYGEWMAEAGLEGRAATRRWPTPRRCERPASTGCSHPTSWWPS